MKKTNDNVIINLLIIKYKGDLMVLNVWDTVKNFINNLFTSIHWNNILIFLMGIIVGGIISGIIYLIIFFKSINKADKINQLTSSKENIVQTSEVNKLISGAKDQYKEETKEYGITFKMETLKDISWDLVKNIANVYYPDSKHPIYELSIDELIKLCYYITERIDNVFQGRILKNVRNFKISQIITIIETKKKIDDNKLIKASKKLNSSGLYKAASTTLNIVNPVYWARKFVVSTSVNYGSSKIANIIIDIVGEETAKVYSKHLFIKENNINEEITELENEFNEE